MLDDFLFAWDYARLKGRWVVLVVPTDLYGEAMDTMAALSDDHPFGGRTLSLTPGHLSVVPVTYPVFLPSDQPFDVMFIEWGRTKTSNVKEMELWKNRAQSVLSR